MIGQRRNVPQSVRLLYLVFYPALLFVMTRMAFDQGLPLTVPRVSGSIPAQPR